MYSKYGPLDFSKLAINWKNGNDITICRHDFIIKYLPCKYFKFSCWSEFHINIINGSRVMTICVYKGLTRNPQIKGTPVWVLSNIWRLRPDRDPNFDTNVYNKMVFNVAKVKGYNFYRFWVIKDNPTGRMENSPSPILGLNH